MGGQKQVKTIKEGLRELRSQLKDQKVHEGLMINSIFNFKNKMTHKGRNHLYDNIEEQIGEDGKEFLLMIWSINSSRGLQAALLAEVQSITILPLRRLRS